MKRIFSLILTLLLIVTFPLNSIAEVVFYDTNHIGSPVAIWDKKGKKVWEGEYYPFGEEYRVTKTPQENKKRFLGKEKDKETGLTYFGARYFDEKTGRFITPDPVRAVDASSSELNSQMLSEPQRLNRYAYSLNNPYRYIDPDGLAPMSFTDGMTEEEKLEHEKTMEMVAEHTKAQTMFYTQQMISFLTSVMSAGVFRSSPRGAMGGTARSWNSFQKKTKGQFSSRAEAAKAWAAYKKTNGIVTGSIRSQAQKRAFLKGALKDGKHPSWMNQWLNKGKVPPGHQVHHKKPLGIGGPDTPSNMNLKDTDLHKLHHRYYSPWIK